MVDKQCMFSCRRSQTNSFSQKYFKNTIHTLLFKIRFRKRTYKVNEIYRKYYHNFFYNDLHCILLYLYQNSLFVLYMWETHRLSITQKCVPSSFQSSPTQIVITYFFNKEKGETWRIECLIWITTRQIHIYLLQCDIFSAIVLLSFYSVLGQDHRQLCI